MYGFRCRNLDLICLLLLPYFTANLVIFLNNTSNNCKLPDVSSGNAIAAQPRTTCRSSGLGFLSSGKAFDAHILKIPIIRAMKPTNITTPMCLKHIITNSL